MKQESLTSGLPAFAGALHPNLDCWAWSGRSSKVAIRSFDKPSTEAESAGDDQGIAGKGGLGGSGKVIDTGKGKFGMDLQFVSARRGMD